MSPQIKLLVSCNNCQKKSDMQGKWLILASVTTAKLWGLLLNGSKMLVMHVTKVRISKRSNTTVNTRCCTLNNEKKCIWQSCCYELTKLRSLNSIPSGRNHLTAEWLFSDKCVTRRLLSCWPRNHAQMCCFLRHGCHWINSSPNCNAAVFLQHQITIHCVT